MNIEPRERSTQSHLHLLCHLSAHLCSDHRGIPHHTQCARGPGIRGGGRHLRQQVVRQHGLDHPHLRGLLHLRGCQRPAAHLLPPLLLRGQGGSDAGGADQHLHLQSHPHAQCHCHLIAQSGISHVKVHTKQNQQMQLDNSSIAAT